jgi:periplasmic protein TonB
MSSKETANLLSSLTLVLWIDCMAAGIFGLWAGNPLPPMPAPAAVPVQAVVLTVDVTPNQPPQASAAASPRMNQTSAPQQQPAPAALPRMPELPVAPALADLSRIIVPAPRARPVQQVNRVNPPTTQPPAIEQLTYGQGEGAQPSPQYPIEAAEAGEQGVVVVRFTVGEDGLVRQASVLTPCRWPLLNRAAEAAIGQTWRFKTGPVRVYQVSIEFRLTGK